jgi:exodeoxyribonuclease-3
MLPTPDAMKIATWNVNGIRARETQVRDWLAREQPDVVCLQEIKASPDQVPERLTGWADYHAHWHGHKGYSGVALLLRRARFAETPAFVHPHFDLENRIVVSTTGPLVLASVYVPNGGKDFNAKMKFFEQMVEWAAELRRAGQHLVLCGDFNVARTDDDVHPSERRPVTGQLPEERALLERLFGDEGGLVDVGRHVDPGNTGHFTWWAPWRNMRGKNIGWRLDYVAASRDLVDASSTCVVQRETGTSDHGPVVAALRDTPAAA